MPPEPLRALRQAVALRAQFRCEYCLYPETRSGFAHQVDHIVSRKHGGLSSLENLAFSCIFCNRYKGSDVAAIHVQTGTPVRLFHPRVHRWPDHFRLHGAVIEPLTREGQVTALVLRFNQAERVIERAGLQNTGQYPRGK
ncbi:MAG: HNH endonuclease [Acidobacteriota bacterium]|nr:HNH endonuclease [Acidobacteriota bacterium]